MKKLIPLLIVLFILISCSGDNGSIEGKIVDVKKGTEIGKFIYIEIETEAGKKEKIFSNGNSFGHYTYDHLISHQISRDELKIDYIKDSEKKIIKSIHKHNRSH